MTGNYAAGGNGSLQLKGAGQLAKGLRQAGIEMKDLRAVNKQAAKNTEPQWTQVYADAVQKIINRITTGDLSK